MSLTIRVKDKPLTSVEVMNNSKPCSTVSSNVPPCLDFSVVARPMIAYARTCDECYEMRKSWSLRTLFITGVKHTVYNRYIRLSRLYHEYTVVRYDHKDQQSRPTRRDNTEIALNAQSPKVPAKRPELVPSLSMRMQPTASTASVMFLRLFQTAPLICANCWRQS